MKSARYALASSQHDRSMMFKWNQTCSRCRSTHVSHVHATSSINWRGRLCVSMVIRVFAPSEAVGVWWERDPSADVSGLSPFALTWITPITPTTTSVTEQASSYLGVYSLRCALFPADCSVKRPVELGVRIKPVLQPSSWWIGVRGLKRWLVCVQSMLFARHILFLCQGKALVNKFMQTALWIYLCARQ